MKTTRVCAIWTEYYSSLTLLTFRNRKHLPSQICEADSFQLSQPSFLAQYFFSFTTFPLIGRDQLQRPLWMRLMQRNQLQPERRRLLNRGIFQMRQTNQR